LLFCVVVATKTFSWKVPQNIFRPENARKNGDGCEE
jgi:hypothetical protein